MKRSGERGSGQFQEITWDEALAEAHVQTGRDWPQRTIKSRWHFMTKPLTGQRAKLISQFLTRIRRAAVVEYEALGDQVLRRANLRSFGYEQLPTLDLANSRYVISFGADFLGPWNSPVAQKCRIRRNASGTSRSARKIRSSGTTNVPDGSECGRMGSREARELKAYWRLGLAHVILRDKLRPDNAGRAGAQVEGWSAGLAAYTPEEVEKRTGVSAEKIQRIAREFAQHQPSIAIIGGAPLAQSNGLANALAVNALNALVGSVGQPGGINFMPRPAGETEQRRAGLTADKFAANLLDAAQQPAQVLFAL